MLWRTVLKNMSYNIIFTVYFYRLSVVEERFEHICKRSDKDISKMKHLAKKNAGLRQTIKVRINFNNREDSRAFYNIGKYIVDV